MWIAKPIRKLNPSEIATWQQLEPELPIAQTLSWAHAIESVQGCSYLIFNPGEKVGGIVFTPESRPHSARNFECINGPHLHWDEPQVATRQLATFALATSKLSSNFQSLSLKPRWSAELSEARLCQLPLGPHSFSHAATLLVPVLHTDAAQLRSFTPRLRRTLHQIENCKVRVSWNRMDQRTEAGILSSFVETLTLFGKKKGFIVPPLSWFQALTQSSSTLSFQLGTAVYSESGEEKSEVLGKSQILIMVKGTTAHYLFGCEIRNKALRSCISTSAILHWEALRLCRSIGVELYDLNGYISEVDPSHTYYGVCQFKRQFSGIVVDYDVPEFLIHQERHFK